MDVVYMLEKGRHEIRAVRLSLSAQRAPEAPHRFLAIRIRVVVEGSAPESAVQRAVNLSHERSCSVWHSMRQDIELTVTVESRP